MGQILYGSICVTDLVAQMNAGHSSGNVGAKNGKVYANVTIFINDEPDQYKNDASICLNSTKEGRAKETEKKTFYIGNLKKGTGGDLAPGQAGLNLNVAGAAPQPEATAGGVPPVGGLPQDLPF